MKLQRQLPTPAALLLAALCLLPLGSVMAEPAASPGHGEPAIYLQLIQRMQQQGAWFASLAHIQAYRQQHGDSPALQLAHADALRQTGEMEQAAALYRRVGRGPLQAAAAHGLGLIAMSQGQSAQAIEQLRLATQLSPLQADYLGDLGYALLLSGDYSAARAPLAQAAELQPGDGRAVANLALWQMLDGHADSARQMMQQANLPAPTQQAVTAQAERLRQQHRPAASNTLTAVHPADKARQLAHEQAQPQPVPAAVRPPGSMLERFSPSTTNQGSTP